MKCYDYEAVAFDGDVYCVGCLPDGISVESEECYPVFADSEWDFYPTCHVCGERHDYVSLTREGVIYEAEQNNAEIFYVEAEEFFEPDTWMFERLLEELGVSTLSDAGEAEQIKEARNLDGWYVWCCLPGCLPDSEADGPFKDEYEAAEYYLRI